ncbi:NADH-quinone oxidoreductase subunit A 1 [Capsulimonas corticalis]|uniref:NADH-quinone oxidoreductase subunit A n=1 Tax=Capsulimonas corticalis TaxID=2219043 RepID=A0A402CYH8_9BACT|nr:NADH-quinone oxidoreductase subunit A [Capsulimonas corticalis]BDI31355.1 NADH-quinone oxidoreductase subunit A 1 [Capsulimonas corticalis]
MPPTTSASPFGEITPNLHSVGEFLPLLILLVVAFLLASVLVGLSWILGPKKPSAAKLASYECGVDPVGSARERFPVKFYLIAMLFIVFDIETVFLYPWAVTYSYLHGLPNGAQIFSLSEMFVFIIILFVGYIYVWKKGAFEWE